MMSEPTLSSPPAFGDLHLLTILAQTHSYTQTAVWAGLSKATVSQRVAALERSVGVPLVQRTTRSVLLTAAGQQLVDETQASFTQITQSFAAVRDLAATPRGLVRLTAPVALGRQHVMPSLTRFLQSHPDIRVELELSDDLVNLVQEGFDLAVRHTSTPPDSYVAWELCPTQAVLVASEAYLARKGVPTSPSELAQHDCLIYLRDAGAVQSWSLVRAGLRGAAPISTRVQGPIKANNSEALRQAALAGLGIALLPDFTVAHADAEPCRLVHVLPQWRVQGFFGERIFAMRPWAPQVPRAVQCLVSHLRSEFGQGFPVPSPL